MINIFVFLTRIINIFSRCLNMGIWLIRLLLSFGQKNHFSIDTELQEGNYYLTSCLQIFLFTLHSVLFPFFFLSREIYKPDHFSITEALRLQVAHNQEESLIKEVITEIYISNCRIQTTLECFISFQLCIMLYKLVKIRTENNLKETLLQHPRVKHNSRRF